MHRSVRRVAVPCNLQDLLPGRLPQSLLQLPPRSPSLGSPIPYIISKEGKHLCTFTHRAATHTLLPSSLPHSGTATQESPHRLSWRTQREH